MSQNEFTGLYTTGSAAAETANISQIANDLLTLLSIIKFFKSSIQDHR